MNHQPDKAVFSFATSQTTEVAKVGGKGASLIGMTRAGMPVPEGFVLSTDFFQPWLDQLRTTPEWDAFSMAVSSGGASDEELRGRATQLQTACADLSFTEVQQRLLAAALADLPGAESTPDGGLFAVRSSAPQEDLAGASFAGIYDSVLALTPAELAGAVRTVFLSGLDFKVVSYKRQRHFDPAQVEIAVVVQQQIDSVSAGVAFSLNPQTNDYDEAVVQSNWGLGETVVSGSVTPDQFIVDTLTGQVNDTRPGAKESTRWHRSGGGTVDRPNENGHGSGQCALTEVQAAEVARLASRVEAQTGTPADIEWAYAPDGVLYLLQARPVTTYFPLPAELLSAPYEPRRLYLDSTLLEEGLPQPLSVLGARWMEDAIIEMVRQVTRLRLPTRARDGLILTVEGRWYANLSSLLWLGTRRLASSMETLDVHAAQVMRNVDARRYKQAAVRPRVSSVTCAVAGTIAGCAGPAGRALAALAAPGHARRRYAAAVTRHDRKLAEAARTAPSLPELGGATLGPTIRLLMREGLPLTCAAEVAAAVLSLLYRRAPDTHRQHLEAALRSMPHNITIDMGLAMYSLARSLAGTVGAAAFADLPALASRIQAREMPAAFLRQWDAFMDSYGFRGPVELDLASARYADDTTMVLDQLRPYTLLDESSHESPQRAFERRQEQRREAYRALLAATGNPLKAWLVKRLYHTAEEFSGFREIHKYHLVRAGYQVRQRALETGSRLVDEGRLDRAEQVFDLTREDLLDDDRTCDNDPTRGDGGTSGPNLRTRAQSNTRYRRKVRQIPGAQFPVIVDSRGHIPRPAPTAARQGVLTGQGVSPGMARGPAKVLAHVGEKPVLPGEILVARATDPGWTPLFVHAAGVVLETGGSFQHGALVAREYGRPCLVGIEDAAQRISDGQIIELDGAAGTLTLVTPAEHGK
ncbi:PEP-utilizing enzyme [Arthrobacter pigmenti]